MPRMPRRDAPGVVHHVMLRGVAQSDIFRDDVDRASLLGRLALVSQECGLAVLAFAFMSNHVHLVTRTGPTPLARAMSRVNTGHALYFNRRHGRVGHLFQNRYKAVPIEDDAQLRVVIRYVHANPLEAGIVRDLAELEAFPWTGHALLVSARTSDLLDVHAALAAFGDSADAARAALRDFMRDWDVVKRDELHGALAPLRLPQLESEIERVAREFGVDPSEVAGGSRRREVCRARAAIAHLAFHVHGFPAAEVALRLGVTHAAVLRGAERGRQEVSRTGVPKSHREV